MIIPNDRKDFILSLLRKDYIPFALVSIIVKAKAICSMTLLFFILG